MENNQIYRLRHLLVDFAAQVQREKDFSWQEILKLAQHIVALLEEKTTYD